MIFLPEEVFSIGNAEANRYERYPGTKGKRHPVPFDKKTGFVQAITGDPVGYRYIQP